MNSRQCMINVMADVIGLDETYKGDRLNDPDTWQRFMADVFKRMDDLSDEAIKDTLNAIDRTEFQQWIDDPSFWMDIDAEIKRRGQIFKTMMRSDHEGHC